MVSDQDWQLILRILDESLDVPQSQELVKRVASSYNRANSVCSIEYMSVNAKIALNLKLTELRRQYLCMTIETETYVRISHIIDTNYVNIIDHIMGSPVCMNSITNRMRAFDKRSYDLLLEISEILKGKSSIIRSAFSVRSKFADFFRRYKVIDLFLNLLTQESPSPLTIPASSSMQEPQALERSKLDEPVTGSFKEVKLAALQIMSNLAMNSPEVVQEYLSEENSQDNPGPVKFVKFLSDHYRPRSSAYIDNFATQTLKLLLVPADRESMKIVPTPDRGRIQDLLGQEIGQRLADASSKKEELPEHETEQFLMVLKSCLRSNTLERFHKNISQKTVYETLKSILKNHRNKLFCLEAIEAVTELLKHAKSSDDNLSTLVSAVAEYLIRTKPKGIIKSASLRFFMEVKKVLTLPIAEAYLMDFQGRDVQMPYLKDFYTALKDKPAKVVSVKQVEGAEGQSAQSKASAEAERTTFRLMPDDRLRFYRGETIMAEFKGNELNDIKAFINSLN